MKIECTEIMFSGHAMQRAVERGIPPDRIRTAIAQAEIIKDYPEDRPFPSYLLLAIAGSISLHVVLAKEKETGKCIVVTVYEPDKIMWSDDLRERK